MVDINKDMGSTISLYVTDKIHEIQLKHNNLCKDFMRLEERVGRLERDIINTTVKVERTHAENVDMSNKVLNIQLLEEGRSTYVPRRRITHAASTYR